MSIAGRQIGDYHLVRPLGVGGMAEVYVAERRGPAGFRREVALKVLRPHLRATSGVAERFTREARLAAGLRHPNVVPVIDFGVDAGVPFLAMELVDGADLRRATRAGVARARPLPPRLAVHVAIQVARGLAHAHTCPGRDGRPLGLVHRDVSPQNILLSRAGEVRLADFGIATAVRAAEESASGTLRGKFAYLAPEVVDGAAADARADLFALGVVLWELLAGRRLFLGATDAETLARVRRCEVPLPLAAPPGAEAPSALWPVLARALARAPETREASAASLAAAFAAAWPEADRGDTAAELAAWLAAACPPNACLTDAGSVPGSDLLPAKAPAEPTPTLVTSVLAPGGRPPTVRSLRVTGRGRRLALAVLLVLPVAAWATLGRGRPEPAARAVAPARPAAFARPAVPADGPVEALALPRRTSLVVTSRPAGARVEIDGRVVGRTPLRVEGLAVGRPVLALLQLDGHRPVERSVTPRLAPLVTLHVPLEPAYGLISLDAEPWAEVWLDGEPMGATPIFERRVRAGRHTLRLVHGPSGRRADVTLDLPPDGHVRHRARLAPAPESAAGDGVSVVPSP